MLALPTTTAPAARRRPTSVASVVARYAKPGQPAVVVAPATSMLSLTTYGTPYSGSDDGSTSARRLASARARSTSGSPINTPGGASFNAASTDSMTSVTDSPSAYRRANSSI